MTTPLTSTLGPLFADETSVADTNRARSELDQWQSSFDCFLQSWPATVSEQLPPNWPDLFEKAIQGQESLRLEGSWWSGPRSLLGVIGARHLEKTHSLVLAWLLDPNERHGLGTRLLERFLRSSRLPTHRAISRLHVDTEVMCGTDLEVSGIVDVLVTGDRWSLVI